MLHCVLSLLVMLAMCSCDVATSHIRKHAMACLASACEYVPECTTADIADRLQMNDCSRCFNAERWHRRSFAGATKGGASQCTQINGIFDLVPELYSGRALFRRRDDKTVWLQFTKGKRWTVSSTASKDANSNSGWALAPSADCDLLPVSGWSVGDCGGAWVPDEDVSVTHSDALLVSLSD